MPVKNKIDGISGEDKICTLMPYDIILTYERPDTPDTPNDEETPDDDSDENDKCFLQVFGEKLIEFLKKLINK